VCDVGRKATRIVMVQRARRDAAYLHPVAIGSDQSSWNHCTCCEPGVVSVRRMRWSRGVEMVGGGIGSVDIIIAAFSSVFSCSFGVESFVCFLSRSAFQEGQALSLSTTGSGQNCLCDSGNSI
jgi:hypothetical protein